MEKMETARPDLNLYTLKGRPTQNVPSKSGLSRGIVLRMVIFFSNFLTLSLEMAQDRVWQSVAV